MHPQKPTSYSSAQTPVRLDVVVYGRLRLYAEGGGHDV